MTPTATAAEGLPLTWDRGALMIDWREHLTSDPQVCDGQLCARGARVFMTNILDSLAEGATHEEILGSYPSLKPEHIQAAVAKANLLQ